MSKLALLEFNKGLTKNAILIDRIYFEDPRFQVSYSIAMQQWEVALGYVIKNFLRTEYKFTQTRSVVKTLESKGLWLINLFELCERVCSLSTEYNTIYVNSSDLFIACVFEFIALDLSKTFNESIQSAKNIRQVWMEQDRANWRLLKIQENPYKSTALSLLVDESIKLCNYSGFVKDRWNPYLRAYSRYISAFTKSPDLGIFEVGENIYVRTGRGHGGESKLDYGKTINCRVPIINKLSVDFVCKNSLSET